jgi:hypothetical protein
MNERMNESKPNGQRFFAADETPKRRAKSLFSSPWTTLFLARSPWKSSCSFRDVMRQRYEHFGRLISVLRLPYDSLRALVSSYYTLLQTTISLLLLRRWHPKVVPAHPITLLRFIFMENLTVGATLLQGIIRKFISNEARMSRTRASTYL